MASAVANGGSRVRRQHGVENGRLAVEQRQQNEKLIFDIAELQKRRCVVPVLGFRTTPFLLVASADGALLILDGLIV